MTIEYGKLNHTHEQRAEEVIIVDDMPDFTKNMESILELDDIRIKVFHRPEDFLNYAATKDFKSCKCLVVDFSMPKLTGYDVYKELFEIVEGYMPFDKLLYTANLRQISEEQKEYMKSLGVDFLQKPNIARLIQKISEKVA